MAAECNKKRKRGKNWSSQETVLLIEAKQFVTSKEGMGSASAKWQAVADHLENQGVLRDVEQCRSKWENMLGDYRSISDHERRNSSPATSYFALSKEQKKDLKLPAKFPHEMYQLLATTGRGDAEMDVLPVVNAAAPFVSGDSFSSEEMPPRGGGETSIVQFREVGSSAAGGGGGDGGGGGGGGGAATTAATIAGAGNPVGKRKMTRSSSQGGVELSSLEAMAKSICDSHDKILTFLQAMEERRIEMEERKLALEKQRMESEKEERLKVFEVLNGMAFSWRKLSEQMVSNRSSSG